GLFGGRGGGIELAEAEGVLEDDGFEQVGVFVGGAFEGEEGAPGVGCDAVAQGGGELALAMGELGRVGLVAEGRRDRVFDGVEIVDRRGPPRGLGRRLERGAGGFEQRGRGRIGRNEGLQAGQERAIEGVLGAVPVLYAGRSHSNPYSIGVIRGRRVLVAPAVPELRAVLVQYREAAI